MFIISKYNNHKNLFFYFLYDRNKFHCNRLMPCALYWSRNYKNWQQILTYQIKLKFTISKLKNHQNLLFFSFYLTGRGGGMALFLFLFNGGGGGIFQFFFPYSTTGGILITCFRAVKYILPRLYARFCCPILPIFHEIASWVLAHQQQEIIFILSHNFEVEGENFIQFPMNYYFKGWLLAWKHW